MLSILREVLWEGAQQITVDPFFRGRASPERETLVKVSFEPLNHGEHVADPRLEACGRHYVEIDAQALIAFPSSSLSQFLESRAFEPFSRGPPCSGTMSGQPGVDDASPGVGFLDRTL